VKRAGFCTGGLAGTRTRTLSLGQNASLGSTSPPFPVDTCNFRAFWQDRRGEFPIGFPNWDR